MRALGAALLVALLASSLARALPDPNGRGRFPVGVTTLTFTKTSVTTGQPRPLATVIWYPAVPGSGTATALGQRDAEALRHRFPLVVFSHGSCGIPTQSTFLTIALASFGFVVAAPPHPGNQFTDGFPACFGNSGDSLANRPADVSFVIDSMLAENARRDSRFFRRLNPRRIGMSGHSLGGLTTLLVAAREPRVRAALALAPVGSADIRIPTMLQGADADTFAPFESNDVPEYARLAGPRFLLEILHTGHFAWADVCAAPIFGTTDCGPGTNTIGQDEAHGLVLRFAVPFVERYVAGDRRWGRLLKPAGAAPGVVLQAEPRR